MIYNAVWGFSEISYYFIYYHLSFWEDYIVYLVFIPAIATFILILLFADETPDFSLIIKGEYSEYRKVIKKMCEINGVS